MATTRRRASGRSLYRLKVAALTAIFGGTGLSSLFVCRSYLAGNSHWPEWRAPCTSPLRLKATCDQSMGWDGPDPEVTGQLRALGRLLRTAAVQLVSAAELPVSGATATYLPDFVGLRLRCCGTALHSAAEALLAEQWAEARNCIGHVPRHALICEEDLEALQEVLAGSLRLPSTELREALLSIVQKVESAGDKVDETLHDFFLKAAAAFRSAARIFKPKNDMNEGCDRRDSRSFRSNRGPPTEIERLLHATPVRERRTLLRALLKHYHPDRNPGREMEVLPVFHYVQNLREDLDRWRA